MNRWRPFAAAIAAAITTVACSSSPSVTFDSDASGTVASTTEPPVDLTTSTPAPADGTMVVTVDPAASLGDVSPLIRGLSGASPEYLTAVGATIDSWGGNTATRYNIDNGHASNLGREGTYRNGSFDMTGDAVRQLLADVAAAGVGARIAVPALGWVAKNDDPNTCSFPDGAGACTSGADATCAAPGKVADPNVTSVPITPEQVAAWVQNLVGSGLAPTYIAMDNEPELWGVTHYDVHPVCTTYEEILQKYVAFADALRSVAPDAKLAGPVMCCWYSWWLTAPGPASGGPADFLTWFVASVRAHDEQVGHRTLDALDVHYYPQSDIRNDDVDEETAALRLRSTRSLYDPGYSDESWVRSTIQLLPRLRAMLDNTYPGTELAISEWEFGADGSMNGALTIADVLAIFGREGVDMASYPRAPAENSPGYFAFKMHGNYDGNGAAFEGTAVSAPSPDVDRLGSFAVIDEDTGTTKLMLINKQPTAALTVEVQLAGATAGGTAALYTFAAADPGAIAASSTGTGAGVIALELPASSITVVEVPA